MIGLDDKKSCKLALSPCERIQGEFAHTADLAQGQFEPTVDAKGALYGRRRLHRMQMRHPTVGYYGVVELWIVLHRARPQRIEARVDAEIIGGLVGIVADNRRFVNLRQFGLGLAHVVGRDGRHRVLEFTLGQVVTAASGSGQIKNQLSVKFAVHGLEILDG